MHKEMIRLLRARESTRESFKDMVYKVNEGRLEGDKAIRAQRVVQFYYRMVQEYERITGKTAGLPVKKYVYKERDRGKEVRSKPYSGDNVLTFDKSRRDSAEKDAPA